MKPHGRVGHTKHAIGGHMEGEGDLTLGQGVPGVLTYEDISQTLHLSIRAVRRLTKMADPLPVFHVNRRAPRVLRTAFVAWLERRALAAEPSKMYRSVEDRKGATTAAQVTGAHEGGDGRTRRRPRQYDRPLGTEGTAHRRAGRPPDSVRRVLQARIRGGNAR